MRNFFPSYRGPAYSRAGTKFCGYSKQTGRNSRPRLVPFQFSISQGLMLEFGNQYMRVLFDGAYVTEIPWALSNATQANPCVITVPASGAATATPVASTATTAYTQGDTVTLTGGTYSSPAVLTVATTSLESVSSGLTGSGYAPNDTITLAGGTFVTAAVVRITTTTVISATVQTAGTGGNSGTVTMSGSTGTGTRFKALCTTGGSGLINVVSISLNGSYTVNPTNVAQEPVNGGGVSGAKLALTMAPLVVSVTTVGNYSVNSVNNSFTQTSTSGSGTGATFVSGVFQPLTATVTTPGVYTVVPSNPVAQQSSSGTGLGATFNMTWGSVAAFASGDWVYISGVAGMTQLNGQTYVLGTVAGSTYTLKDVFGNNIDSTGFSPYTSGGTVSRIYTLPTVYSDADLDWLKFTESADELTLCCVNQDTGAEYPAQNLVRFADDDWAFTAVAPAPSVLPPSGTPTVTVTAAPSGATADQEKAYYQYVITSIDPNTGTESIASAIGLTGPATDISQVLGTATINWSPVNNVKTYYVYKAPIGFGSYAPAGCLFGFIGVSPGTTFLDRNITPDFTQVPPTHENPFARGQVVAVNMLSGGVVTGTTATVTVNTATGSGANVQLLINDLTNVGQGFIIADAGANYAATDTITVSGTGVSGVLATPVIGPQAGTYPGTVSYFQQRRAYGYSLNQPDTYWMSQPGSFENFDGRTPPIASDAITGSPWATQVNGIQWMLQTSGGLLVMTGLSAWLLVGSGSFATNVAPISPSNQDNVPQAFSGCSPKVFPIRVNYDVLYVTSKNSHYYDLPYQLYALSEPIDISDVSAHLFDNYTIVDNAWCEQPNKLMWALRSDGVMLSLTYYKTQQIQGWSRHDTFGQFVSCASVTELPVDALYLATQRTINGNTAYMVERMDNRLWPNVEATWCVDCGLALAQPQPAATLSISSAAGSGVPTGVTSLVGGSGYSAGTTATVTDIVAAGGGSGATATLTIVGGVITAVNISGGTGYLQPTVTVYDPAGSAGGSGFSARVTLNNVTTLTASAGVFAVGNVGSVVRAGNGVAVITAYTDNQHVTANVLTPFPTVPNSTTAPLYTSGNWTMTAPVTTITGLNYLAGATVTGLADGNVIPPTVVSASGSITLATAASAVTVGLGYQCQMQTPYADGGEPTMQGQRKKMAAVTLRLENSRGVRVGADQIDGSTQSPMQLAPVWSQMQNVPSTGMGTPGAAVDAPNFPPKPYNALATPLRTGDVRCDISSGWQTPGQIAVQQDFPLPCQIVAIIPEFLPGDTPQAQARPMKQAQR